MASILKTCKCFLIQFDISILSLVTTDLIVGIQLKIHSQDRSTFRRGNQKCKNANRFPGVGLTTLLRGTQLNRRYDRGPVIFKQYNSEMFDIISLSKSCCFVEQISIFIIKYFHNISMNHIFTKPIHLKTELSELSCAVPQTMVMNSPLNKMSRKYEITAMYFCLCSISMRSTG